MQNHNRIDEKPNETQMLRFIGSNVKSRPLEVRLFFVRNNHQMIQLCYYYLENNMSLPVINNRNTKNLQKKGNLQEISSPNLQEFGLGIQVFKIEANKLADSNPGKQRRFMKNIENPISAQPSPAHIKKTHILPSLSCEKRQKLCILNDTMLHRRTAVQNKKPSLQPDIIKQVEQRKRPIEKKTVGPYYGTKITPFEQANQVLEEKTVIYQHYHPSYNEISMIYSHLEERQLENNKEIKRLRKAKQNNTEELQKKLRLRETKGEMVESLLLDEKFGQYRSYEEYDQFSLQDYMQGGEKFTYHDQKVIMEY